MAKPEDDELPTGTKALQGMVGDLRTQVAQEQQGRAADTHAHEQAIERLVEGHETALEAAAAVARDASEAAARAIASAEEMGSNRDAWLARIDRAQACLSDAAAALNGVDPEPEETTEPSTEGEAIALPPVPEPGDETDEG